MKNKGFKNVSFLMLGMTAWKAANPVLYEKFAGKNVKKLKL